MCSAHFGFDPGREHVFADNSPVSPYIGATKNKRQLETYRAENKEMHNLPANESPSLLPTKSQ